MWDIYLGFNPQIVPYHWQLVFLWNDRDIDDSLECSSDCDETSHSHYGWEEDSSSFELVNDVFTPVHRIHTVHDVRDDAGVYVYHHLCANIEGHDIVRSETLGHCTDSALFKIISDCDGLDMPDGTEFENCQDWVMDALDSVVDSQATLLSGWRQTLEAVQEMEQE